MSTPIDRWMESPEGAAALDAYEAAYATYRDAADATYRAARDAWLAEHQEAMTSTSARAAALEAVYTAAYALLHTQGTGKALNEAVNRVLEIDEHEEAP